MSACELAEAIVWNGRDINTLWTSGTDLPRTQQVRQVSGVCLTENGNLALVSEAGTNWNLPGGHPDWLVRTLGREARPRGRRYAFRAVTFTATAAHEGCRARGPEP